MNNIRRITNGYWDIYDHRSKSNMENESVKLLSKYDFSKLSFQYNESYICPLTPFVIKFDIDKLSGSYIEVSSSIIKIEDYIEILLLFLEINNHNITVHKTNKTPGGWVLETNLIKELRNIRISKILS